MKKFKNVLLSAAMLIAMVTAAAVTPAYGSNPAKLSPDLRNVPANQKVQVIVQYAPGTQVQCTGLLGLVDCLVNDVTKLGGTVLGDLPLVNGLVASLDGTGVLNLSNQSNVVYISVDRPLTPSLSNAAPAVNAFAAWQSGYTGAGIGVALIDSGISPHPDLNGGFLGHVAGRVEPKLRPRKRFGNRSIRPRHTRCRPDRGQRRKLHRQAIFTHVRRHRSASESDQSSRSGCEWQRQHQRGDLGDQHRYPSEACLQHSRDQSFPEPADL
jgi:subtilisin family serine protease